MSIASALFGLGIALTSVGGFASFVGVIVALTTMDVGNRHERRRAYAFLAVVVGVFAVGVFLLGLTSPAVQS